jgi:hypothetical protein
VLLSRRLRIARERLLDAALEGTPGDVETLVHRGVARTNWAELEARRKRDPSGLFGPAMEDFARALEGNDGRAETWLRRGSRGASGG